jgi:carotenoid cleavage dioxygenase
MSQTTRPVPFYLQGNFAPVSREVTAFDLPVQGALPPELRGLYLRNGPNPRGGQDPGHWFLGDGMVHGVRLEGGRAAWYRNRWVRTRFWTEDDPQLVGRDGRVDHTVAKANTNVVGHAGRIFALVESSFPTELTPELDTIGICDFDGRLKTSMTAHPKLCPTTGELHFFGYQFVPPWLTYHRLDAGGRLVQSEEIPVAGPTMIHDFAITDGHLVFMDLPVVFTPKNLLEGRFPYAWSDDYGARLGVLPRGGRGGEVRWLEIDPCYVFHPMNAFERGGRIVLDVARYERLWDDGPEGFAPAFLHRFTLDLASGKVGEERLDDRPVEFPRVDERRVGLQNRYGYAVSDPIVPGRHQSQLVKYDLETGASRAHEFGQGCRPGEAVMVPAGPHAGEDEGFVLCFVHDAARDASELVVLDAARFEAAPIARVALPQRVPFGFHGNWLPDAP